MEMVELVQRTLENDGILQSIRAQLRANVYNVITKQKSLSTNGILNDFKNNDEGYFIFCSIINNFKNIYLLKKESRY